MWLGRHAASVGYFLAGPRSWLNQGPYWSPRTPFAVVRSLLEAIAASFRGWEPHPVALAPPIRIFPDAAPDPHFPGHYVVGLWSPWGPTIRRVSVWVDNQQAAKLYGALAALDLVRRSPQPHVQLVLDNMGAIARILWGQARVGRLLSLGTRLPPPPLQALHAHLVTKGQWLTAIHMVAPKAPKNFFHSPCQHSIPPRPGGGAPQRYT